jgi:dTDP-4-amino-4,6-dideoxygalactose transaminase
MNEGFIPFAPPDIGEQEIAAVVEALRSGWVTTGPRTQRFEQDFARRQKSPAALAVNSGTAAMHLALEAAGIGPGDEVVVPALTFCSTALVVEHVGATPVAVDVEADTLNLAPAAVEAALTPRTRAIIAVHFAGHPVDLDALRDLARQRDLLLLEDAAHATGTSWRGEPIGAAGNPVAFSFYATKNLCTGEGGMLTGEPELVERARILSLHGMDRDAWKRYDKAGAWRYDVVASGWKYNMTDIQAALGLVQLERFDAMQARRGEVVAGSQAAFAESDALELPVCRPHAGHAWHLYVLRLRLEALDCDRDQVMAELREAGIGCSVHFIPLHQLSHFANRWDPATLPVVEAVAPRLLSLPLHPRLGSAARDRIVGTLLEILETHRR